MRKYMKYMLLFFLAGCSLFETRDPEDPINTNSSFKPPYTAGTVISNFVNSIAEKNPNNYIACFSDSSQGDAMSFVFVPSQEAMSNYPGLFVNWSLTQEKRHINYLVNNISTDSVPFIYLANTTNFDVLLTDSAIITTDYELTPRHSKEKSIIKFRGTLQFALYRRKSNGWWSIQRWSDNRLENDSASTTWSILKGIFY